MSSFLVFVEMGKCGWGRLRRWKAAVPVLGQRATSYVFFTISVLNTYRLYRTNDFTQNSLTYASRHQNCYNHESTSPVRKKRLETCPRSNSCKATVSLSLSDDSGRLVLKLTEEVKCNLNECRQVPEAWGGDGELGVPPLEQPSGVLSGWARPLGKALGSPRSLRPEPHPPTPAGERHAPARRPGTGKGRESRSGHPEPGSPLRPTVATKGRVAAWPFSDSRVRQGRFASRTGGFGVAGTAACSRGRSAPATPRDVADRTGANGPERAATDNMATAAANT